MEHQVIQEIDVMEFFVDPVNMSGIVTNENREIDIRRFWKENGCFNGRMLL